MRIMFHIVNTGPVLPAILHLSDGGHIENLALLPLLKRRLQRIVVVNGGHIGSDISYGDDLVHALQLARGKLNCSFLSEDGRDVIEDIREKFVTGPDHQHPRSYRFRVDYYERKENEEGKKVGEGEVILIAPRHPDKGIQHPYHVIWDELSGDLGPIWKPRRSTISRSVAVSAVATIVFMSGTAGDNHSVENAARASASIFAAPSLNTKALTSFSLPPCSAHIIERDITHA